MIFFHRGRRTRERQIVEGDEEFSLTIHLPLDNNKRKEDVLY